MSNTRKRGVERQTEERPRVLCLDPEIPDLSDEQLKLLHELGDYVQKGFDHVGDKVDLRVSLAILLIHLTKPNRDLVRDNGSALGADYPRGRTKELDALAVAAAQGLFEAADRNLRLHVRFKKPPHA